MLDISRFSWRLTDDLDAHGPGGAGDGLHRGIDAARRHVRHLELRDLFELLARDLTDLLLARLVGARALLLLGVELGGLLQEDRRRRRLEDEGEGAVLIH